MERAVQIDWSFGQSMWSGINFKCDLDAVIVVLGQVVLEKKNDSQRSEEDVDSCRNGTKRGHLY